MKPLTRCPQCEYSRRGLPPDHKCPECGFEYDVEATIWESRPSKKGIAAILLGGCFVIWTILSDVLSGGFPPASVPGILALFFSALLLFVLYRAFVTSRAGSAVCTTGEGLLIKFGRDAKLYPWGDVEGAFWDVANKIGGVKFRGSSRPLYFYKILKKQSDFEDFAHEVRRRKQAE